MKIKKILTLSLCTILFLGTDVSAQWTQLNNLSQIVNCVHEIDTNLLVGTSVGVFYSSDSGSTWTASAGISSGVKSFTQAGTDIFACSYGRVFQSSDNGASWDTLPIIYSGQYVNNLLTFASDYVAGMNGNGIYFSADSGINWWSSATSWQSRNTAIVRKKNELFSSYRFSGYMQTSPDSGQSWLAVNGDGIKVGMSSSFQDINAMVCKNDSILIAGTNNTGGSAIYNGVYFSYNNADNWTERSTGITNKAINTITMAGNLVFVGTDGGGVFYSSDDGMSWDSLSDGLAKRTINRLYYSNSTLYSGDSITLNKIDISNLLQNTSTLYITGTDSLEQGDSIRLQANYSGISYQWFLNNSALSNTNNNFMYAKQSGEYKVAVRYSDSFVDTSNVITLRGYSGPKGLNDNKNTMNAVVVYPNPVEGELYLSFSKVTTKTDYEIYASTGRLVLSGTVRNNLTRIDVDDLENGVYVIQIGNDLERQMLKFVKN